MIPRSQSVVGIDLGTTNSTIAVVQDGVLTVIPVHGQPTMPSAVGIDPAGRLVVGQAAKNQAISAPENTVLSIKRLMGTEQPVELGGKAYRPEEISALILGELKRAAEAHLGEAVTRAVITVPAFFNERQRIATQDAGHLAGLEVLRIINEPTAAALAYGAGQAADLKQETLLVYDLGGGTFDVSVVRVEDGIVEVRASHGDIHLGGDDFDEALAVLGEAHLREKHGDAAGTLPAAAHRRLKSAMEIAKIQLSDAPFAGVREEYLTPSCHLDMEIARLDYQGLIEPWLHKTLDCLQRTLADAGVTADGLDKVMLVGGATRTPYVQELLLQKLGMEPRHEIDPDLVVAMGAAIQGAALAGQPAPAILIDISAHTYSVLAAVGYDLYGDILGCCPVVRRGTALPVTKADLFSTHVDNQTAVRIVVYQGESERPEDNLRIGEFMVRGLSRVPAGNEIIVQFRIDLNGLLTATATEKRTGLAKSVTIDTAGQHRINLDAARTNLAALFAEQEAAHPHPAGEGGRPQYLAIADDDEDDDDDDEDDEDDEEDEDDDDDTGDDDALGVAAADRIETGGRDHSISLLASAKSLRNRAEKLLARGVAESDAAAIRASLAEVAPAIEARDWRRLRHNLDALSDLLFYLDD
ncbi:MAG: Hsp70 family protein [Verrucomicrobia bacterium]|nr:Hsp70 family protein [Verrucomicrobiota bacterium]